MYDDSELNRFKRDVHLLRYAVERHGYQRDPLKSSLFSHVLGHPTSGDKIIARRDVDGHWTYFSVRDEHDNGTVIDFVQRRAPSSSLGEVRKELRHWLGTTPPDHAEWQVLAQPAPAQNLKRTQDTFEAGRLAETCWYLESRGLARETLSSPRFAGTWRIGARDNVLFPHHDNAGALTGFEMKNRGFTGFSTGGTKSAWQSNPLPSDRGLVIAESAIDALSYRQLHHPESDGYRYLSTAGAPSRAQFKLLDRLCSELTAGGAVIAALDRDAGGDWLADRLEWITSRHQHLSFQRHSPEREKDWNDVLQRTRSRGLGR
jgi:hypothetical protein